jgi:hypothetical protein
VSFDVAMMLIDPPPRTSAEPAMEASVSRLRISTSMPAPMPVELRLPPSPPAPLLMLVVSVAETASDWPDPGAATSFTRASIPTRASVRMLKMLTITEPAMPGPPDDAPAPPARFIGFCEISPVRGTRLLDAATVVDWVALLRALLPSSASVVLLTMFTATAAPIPTLFSPNPPLAATFCIVIVLVACTATAPAVARICELASARARV